jgi:hypothetical protein
MAKPPMFPCLLTALVIGGCVPSGATLTANADYKIVVARSLDYTRENAQKRRILIGEPFLNAVGDFMVCTREMHSDGRGGFTETFALSIFMLQDGRISMRGTNWAEVELCTYQTVFYQLEPV